MMKILYVIILIVCCLFSNVKAQQPPSKIGIVNGRTTYMPHPVMTKEAQSACIGGKVEVEVKFHEYKGNVVSAKAISGNELLRKPTEDAARKARFAALNITTDNRDFYTTGILVYNFPQPKCVSVKILNKDALKIPKPLVNSIPENVKISYPQTVTVQIGIDRNRDVISAETVSGHPLLKSACKISAQGAKFPVSLFNNTKELTLRGTLIYKFKSEKRVKF